MDTEDHDPPEEIAVLARGMHQERRRRFLDAACGGDPALRAQVEALLASPSGEGGGDGDGDTQPDALESIALDALADPRAASDAAATQPSPAGRPIHDHCAGARANAIDRLRLFQRLCRLVGREHRHGRLHGGLTPEHVLVTPDGAIDLVPPEPAAVDDSETPARSLPYTSPEQVLGEPITTATDVYALGLILYELMTGRYPYHPASSEAGDLCNAICQQAPERPSLAVAAAPDAAPDGVRRLLAGDLEPVILHALQKEPERRYATPDQLAQDIDRVFQKRPVTARRETRSYRAAMFARRHPVITVLTLTATAAALLGLAASTILLRRSNRERARLDTAYRTARSGLDELVDQIDGDTRLQEPRLRLLRDRVLQPLLHYYETARFQQGRDAASLRDAVDAQVRVAAIHRLIGSLDTAAWQYEQALTDYERLMAQDPSQARDRDSVTRLLVELGEILSQTEGRGEAARSYLDRAEQMLTTSGESPETDPGTETDSAWRQRALARVLSCQAELERAAGRPQSAQALWRRLIELLGKRLAAQPHSLADVIRMASAQIGLGLAQADQPETRRQGALDMAGGVALREAIVREHPDRVDQVQQLALDHRQLAELYQRDDQLELGSQAAGRSVELFEQLSRRDPEVLSHQVNLYLAHDLASRLQNKRGNVEAAVERSRQALAVLEKLAAAHPKDLTFQLDLANCHGFIGRLLQHRRKNPEGLQSLQRAIDILESIPRLDPPHTYQLAANLALAMSLIGAGANAAPPPDESSLAPADRLRRQLYATRAMTTLRRAVAAGAAAPEVLRSDPDLDPLRDRPDFQELLRDRAENTTQPEPKPESKPKPEPKP